MGRVSIRFGLNLIYKTVFRNAFLQLILSEGIEVHFAPPLKHFEGGIISQRYYSSLITKWNNVHNITIIITWINHIILSNVATSTNNTIPLIKIRTYYWCIITSHLMHMLKSVRSLHSEYDHSYSTCSILMHPCNSFLSPTSQSQMTKKIYEFRYLWRFLTQTLFVLTLATRVFYSVPQSATCTARRCWALLEIIISINIIRRELIKIIFMRYTRLFHRINI